jgi:Alpha-L-arabinofuranosidase
MFQENLLVNRDFALGEAEDRLFGSFVEHMGSVVYGGIYEPEHPQSDKNGFRKDVIDAVHDLNLSVVRYPGGNFSSGYNWEDTVGPANQRPVRLDLAWRAVESNAFGLDEFMKWAELAGVDPILTVNLGTRGVDAARSLIEYCNYPGGSYWSDRRIADGAEAPYRIKLWCLGNELDGKWQLGSKTADEYGRLACETAKAMRLVDPDIELIAVGSSLPQMETFPQWDETVLFHTYDVVDYIALHNYIDKGNRDTAAFLASSTGMEDQIHTVRSVCDIVKAKKRSKKTMKLAFDEWNVRLAAQDVYIPWQKGFPIDRVSYSMEYTLVFSSMLLALLRNADCVKIACQSLLVNTSALLMTEKSGIVWKNAIFYPLWHASNYGRGTVLKTVLHGDTYRTEEFGEVPYLDSVTVYREEQGEITIFGVNRSADKLSFQADLQGFKPLELMEHIALRSEKLTDINTLEHPNLITPTACRDDKLINNRLESVVEGYSWNVIRLKEAGAKG